MLTICLVLRIAASSLDKDVLSVDGELIGTLRITGRVSGKSRNIVWYGSLESEDVIVKPFCRREFQIYQHLRENNFIFAPRFIGTTTDKYMVIQKVEGKTIAELLGWSAGPERKQILAAYADSLFHALSSLWELNVTHGDLHSRNVLLNEGSGQIFIIDYEYSKLHKVGDCMADDVLVDTVKDVDIKHLILTKTKMLLEKRSWKVCSILQHYLA